MHFLDLQRLYVFWTAGLTTVYIKEVKIFMKETTVGDLMDHWPGCELVSDLNYAKLKAKFKGDPKTYTLERLNRFRRKFCGQVRLSELIFCLISFESTESFSAIWIIPAAIIPELSEAIHQLDESFFEEEHIISIFVNQKQLYPSTISSSQYEVRTTKVIIVIILWVTIQTHTLHAAAQVIIPGPIFSTCPPHAHRNSQQI